MSRPHPALLEIAAGHELPPVADPWALLRSAREHRMSGMLWSAERHRAGIRPEPWRAELQREDMLVRSRSQLLWRALETVVERLDGVGVEVAAIKGVTNEARWFGRQGERPCDDVDVLIGPADLGRVDEIVHALQPGHPLVARLPALVRRGALSALAIPVEGVPVDLHFDLLQLGLPLRDRWRVWERTLPFRLPGGRVVRVLDSETALVHLLLNLNKDRFARLLGYVEIGQLLRREELNWQDVDEMVRAEGLETPTYLALQAVRTTLAIAEGPRFVPHGKRALLWRFLWRPSLRLRGEEGRLHFRHRQHLLAVTARGRSREALQLWWRLVFPGPALVRYAFPRETGPWLWRLAALRALHSWQRRRRTRTGPTGGRSAVRPPSPTGDLPDHDVDGWSVPVVSPTVSSVNVDGEAVLLDKETGALCLLDPVATVAWACFDGSSAVDDVVADLATGFGADAELVRADVISFARRLAREGMLQL